MSQELKPCPFCGSHAETDFIPKHHSYAIECYSIGCEARIIKETPQDAIEAWNSRVARPIEQIQSGSRRILRALLKGGYS